MMNIEDLNRQYGLASELTVQKGNGDFPVIHINNSKAKAKIALYSGHILSFQPHTQTADLIFVSDNSLFQNGKAIRGGCPLCWPWFGPDPSQSGRPNHGFVRNRMWNILATETLGTGETRVQLELQDTPDTQSIWPHAFHLELDLIVGESLQVNLITENTGSEMFRLTQALHTYLHIGDIHQVKVQGLENLSYLDKVAGGTEKQQIGDVIIAEEVDRIYLNVPPELIVDDPALNRKIIIHSEGNRTAIVWNPWADSSATMADLGDLDYQKFICVETANAASDVVELQPGRQCRLSAKYHIASC